jgi:septum site-determining protein MinD
LAGQAYKNIVRRIMGEDVPFMNLESGDGFFNRVAKLFGLNKKR